MGHWRYRPPAAPPTPRAQRRTSQPPPWSLAALPPGGRYVRHHPPPKAEPDPSPTTGRVNSPASRPESARHGHRLHLPRVGPTGEGGAAWLIGEGSGGAGCPNFRHPPPGQLLSLRGVAGGGG